MGLELGGLNWEGVEKVRKLRVEKKDNKAPLMCKECILRTCGNAREKRQNILVVMV